jgi:hypothetical protein
MPPKSALSDDCFARLDAALEKLAKELDVRSSPDEKQPAAERQPPSAPVTAVGEASPLRIVPPGSPEPTRSRVSTGYGQPMEEYAEAFDLLDAQLAGRAARTLEDQPVIPASLSALDERLTADAPTAAIPGREVGDSPMVSVSPPPAIPEPAPSAPSSEPVEPAPLGGPQPLPAPMPVAAVVVSDSRGANLLDLLLTTLHNLSTIQRELQGSPAPSEDRVSIDTVRTVLEQVIALCDEFRLQTARVRVDFAVAALQAGQRGALSKEIDELVRHLRHDLQACTVIPVPAERMWSLSVVLDDVTAGVFPSARTELAEAGLCFSLARYSAAAFHLLRAADPALRALASATDPRRGRTKERDVLNGAALLNLLEARLDRAERSPNSADSDQGVDFLDTVLIDVRRIQEAERLLTRGPLDQQQVLTLYHATRDLLARVAAPLSKPATSARRPTAPEPLPFERSGSPRVAVPSRVPV